MQHFSVQVKTKEALSKNCKTDCPNYLATFKKNKVANSNMRLVDNVEENCRDLPQFHVSISENQGQIVPSHVLGFSGEEENPVGVVRFKIQRELKQMSNFCETSTFRFR